MRSAQPAQIKTDQADQTGTEKKLAVLPPSRAVATQMASQISMPESPHVTLLPVQAVVEERIRRFKGRSPPRHSQP
jgi:hypothetical protein